MNSRFNKNENVKKIKAVTTEFRGILDGETIDIFEAVDDKFVYE